MDEQQKNGRDAAQLLVPRDAEEFAPSRTPVLATKQGFRDAASSDLPFAKLETVVVDDRRRLHGISARACFGAKWGIHLGQVGRRHGRSAAGRARWTGCAAHLAVRRTDGAWRQA